MQADQGKVHCGEKNKVQLAAVRLSTKKDFASTSDAVSSS